MTNQSDTQLNAVSTSLTQEWDVVGMYLDNSQPYETRVRASTATEACYMALMERMTDFGLRIGIIKVSNEDRSQEFLTSSLFEYELLENKDALLALLNGLQAFPETATKTATLAWWLRELLADTAPDDTMDYLSESDDSPVASPEPIFIGATDTPSQALLKICQALEAVHESPRAFEQAYPALYKAVCHVKALCEFFTQTLNDEQSGLCLNGAPELTA